MRALPTVCCLTILAGCGAGRVAPEANHSLAVRSADFSGPAAPEPFTSEPLAPEPLAPEPFTHEPAAPLAPVDRVREPRGALGRLEAEALPVFARVLGSPGTLRLRKLQVVRVAGAYDSLCGDFSASDASGARSAFHRFQYFPPYRYVSTGPAACLPAEHSITADYGPFEGQAGFLSVPGSGRM